MKGYSVNVTESCDKGELNLISGVEVKESNAADNGYLEKGVIQAGEVLCESTEKVHADGAYHSVSNQEFVSGKNAELILNAIQDPKGRYDLEMDENGVLTVKDLKTAVTVEALKMKNGEKWRIKTAEHYRYFTVKELTACLLRKKIATYPQEVLNIRNNVEATIFQLGYHYPNDKTRYRGLVRHKMWANIRCLWVNFVRIAKHVLKHDQETNSQLQHSLLLPIESFTCQFMAIIRTVKMIFINKSNLFSKTTILAAS